MKEKEPKPSPKRPYVSPSQIGMYTRCGEQYRRRYIEREIIPPSIALARGSSIHKAAETNFVQKKDSREDMKRKDVVEVAVETLKAIVANEGLFLTEEEKSVGKDKVVSEGERSVVTLSGLYADEVAPRYQPKLVEFELAIPLPDVDVDLLGRVDLVDEKDVIVDLKTGARKKPQSDVDSSEQLTTYAFVYHALTGKPPAGIVIETLVDTKTPTTQTLETTRTRDDYNALASKIVRVVDGIRKEVFPPSYGQVGAWWCSAKFCGYHATCPFVPANRRGKE